MKIAAPCNICRTAPPRRGWDSSSDDQIQEALDLPDSAFSYLRSHGTLDQEHTKHLAELVNQMTPEDQAEVLRCARVFYRLYGDIFRALPTYQTRETAACN